MKDDPTVYAVVPRGKVGPILGWSETMTGAEVKRGELVDNINSVALQQIRTIEDSEVVPRLRSQVDGISGVI